MKEEEYLNDRIEKERKYYSAKAIANKRLNIALKSLTVILATLIPFVNNVEFQPLYKNIIIGGFGTLVAILTAVGGLFRFHEKWLMYRSASEGLKSEVLLYRTRSGVYKGVADPFDLLVMKIEERILDEHTSWKGVNKENV